MRAFEEGKLEEILAEVQYVKLLLDHARNKYLESTSMDEGLPWQHKYHKLKKEYDGIMSVGIIHWLNE